MQRRVIIKTILICMGIFVMLSAGLWYYVFSQYKFDTQKDIKVVVATKKIEANTIINRSELTYKTIKESGFNNSMITNMELVDMNKSLFTIATGDYIRNYGLVPKDKVYRDDERAIVMEVDVEKRLANLINKGSYVDIMVSTNDGKLPKLVLSKVYISEILDDYGAIMESSTIGNKKGFLKFILNKQDREKIYAAKEAGQIFYELYCDMLQKPAKTK